MNRSRNTLCGSRYLRPAIVLAVVCGLVFAVAAEKVLVYDEERGIIFVDKNEYQRKKARNASSARKDAGAERGRSASSSPPINKRESTDLHVGRKKDPPELYFRSGLEYFKAGDYANAEKNFEYASEQQPRGEYYLWLGKTYRQLGEDTKMLRVMRTILNRYQDGDVADDALFEIAFFYQRTDHYDSAAINYRLLAEQYPFGVSYSNGEEFREVSRKQQQLMRAEMISTLKILGYHHEALEESYRKFQRDNDLEITGAANRETVSTIKALYAARLESDAALAKKKKQVRIGMRWAVAAGGVLFLNLVAAIVMRTSISRQRQHVDSLTKTLNDLDVQSL